MVVLREGKRYNAPGVIGGALRAATACTRFAVPFTVTAHQEQQGRAAHAMAKRRLRRR